MVEPPDRFHSSSSTNEQVLHSGKLVGKDSRGIQSTFEVEHGEEKWCGTGKSPGYGSLRSTMDNTEPDHLESARKQPHARVRPAEQFPPMLSQSNCERKFDRKKSQSGHISKTNAQYHKLFKEISKDDLLKQSYTCALQKDILYQGKMFVSDNWICFHSKVFGKDTKIAIPVLSVTLIKKTKTAILVPNAIVIATTNERHVFVSFLSRDNTFKLLKSISIHLDVGNTGTSPVASLCESSFREDGPPSLPMDLCGDLSDLDNVVHHRRAGMLGSSSSGSQTSDYEKMADFASVPETFLRTENGEVSVHADVHLQTATQKHRVPPPNGPTKPTLVHREKHQPSLLTGLLLMYLFLVSALVLSSCYMAFKIVTLEQRLNSLVSMGEFIRHESVVNSRGQAGFNAEIYKELTSNLLKIEKIQKNLRRLLDET